MLAMVTPFAINEINITIGCAGQGCTPRGVQGCLAESTPSQGS
jgi:hypothetical protein